MAEISVVAEARFDRGTRPARRLRAAGKIPGVIYGHGTEPIAVAVEARALRTALTSDAGLNALIDMAVGSSRHLVVARELQRNPVRGTVSHVDFQVVRRDEVITAEVPITLVGEAVEVAHGDGRVEQQLFALTIKAFPSDIPTSMEVDVSGLILGGVIKVGDLSLPKGVVADVDPDAPVVVGQGPRKAVVGEGEETPEGEASASTGGSSSGEG